MQGQMDAFSQLFFNQYRLSDQLDPIGRKIVSVGKELEDGQPRKLLGSRDC